MPDPSEEPTPREADPAPVEATAVRRPRDRITPQTAPGAVLLAYAALNGLAGLFMLTFPRVLCVSGGGAEGENIGNAYASSRFAGAALVALAVAALLVMRDPTPQTALMTVLAIESTLAAVGMIRNAVIDEVPADGWFTWLIALGSAALAGFMWWARIFARRALKGQ